MLAAAGLIALRDGRRPPGGRSPPRAATGRGSGARAGHAASTWHGADATSCASTSAAWASPRRRSRRRCGQHGVRISGGAGEWGAHGRRTATSTTTRSIDAGAWSAFRRRAAPDVREPHRLVLASASPRRQALVGMLGLAWRVAPADIDEAAYAAGRPVRRRAATWPPPRHARSDRSTQTRSCSPPTRWSCSTATCSASRPTPTAARCNARGACAARAHQVLTGVAAARAGERQWGAACVSTRVEMREYADARRRALHRARRAVRQGRRLRRSRTRPFGRSSGVDGLLSERGRAAAVRGGGGPGARWAVEVVAARRDAAAVRLPPCGYGRLARRSGSCSSVS